MQNTTEKIRYLYALFNQSNPELINPYQAHIDSQHIVAAKLIAATYAFSTTTIITNIDNKEYIFPLNLTSRTHQSKGDWIWVTQIEIFYPEQSLITMTINTRVVDIPYTGSKVCAHWLFRNIRPEINEALSHYL